MEGDAVYCALTLATGPDFSAYRIRTSIMHMYVSNGLLSSELMHMFGNLDAVWHAVGIKVFFFLILNDVLYCK